MFEKTFAHVDASLSACFGGWAVAKLTGDAATGCIVGCFLICAFFAFFYTIQSVARKKEG